MIDCDSKKDVKWWNSKWLAGKYFSLKVSLLTCMGEISNLSQLEMKTFL